MAASTDDDFATDPVPVNRRMPWRAVLSAELGIATALLYMQITSDLAVRFGVATAAIAIAYASVLSAGLGYLVSRLAVPRGLGCNLLAREVLGQRGSVLFSLIYGGNALVYFAFEATIMGASVQTLLPRLDLHILLPVITCAMVPLVWFGMKLLARFQSATFVLYAVLLLWAIVRASALAAPAGSIPPSLALPGLMQALAVMNSVVFITAFVSADFTRFLRVEDGQRGILRAGVGFQVFCFLFSGILGLWFAMRTGESNPGHYFVGLLGIAGVVFAFATQLRINLSNLYAGSLALANIFSEGLGWAAGRQAVLVVFASAIAGTLYLGLLHDMTFALTVIGMFTTCFTCLTLADGYLVGREPGVNASFRWPAIAALVLGTMAGSVLQFGLLGAWGPLVAGPVAVVLEVAVFLALKWPAIGRRARPEIASIA